MTQLYARGGRSARLGREPRRPQARGLAERSVLVAEVVALEEAVGQPQLDEPVGGRDQERATATGRIDHDRSGGVDPVEGKAAEPPASRT